MLIHNAWAEDIRELQNEEHDNVVVDVKKTKNKHKVNFG